MKSHSVSKGIKDSLVLTEIQRDKLANKLEFRSKITKSNLLDNLLIPLNIQENNLDFEERNNNIEKDLIKNQSFGKKIDADE